MTGFDVFLSYNEDDREDVELIARRLREEVHLEPFLDRWHLVPGEPWQEALEEGLDTSQVSATSTLTFSMGQRFQSLALVQMVRHWRRATPTAVSSSGMLGRPRRGQPWEGHEKAIADLAFSPDGKRLVSASLDSNNTLILEMLCGIEVGQLLALFDSCHSGGAGDPKGLLPHIKRGLSGNYYQALAQGKGASSSPPHGPTSFRGRCQE